MNLKESILNKISSFTDPFPHWELESPFSSGMINELQGVKISDAMGNNPKENLINP